MEDYTNIYKNIANRMNGCIYVGVVGPVRTGKSTFIKRFMDLLVVPNIENEYERERALDELPQSSGGRMIMTTEPKFVPNEAAQITIGDDVTFKVRMVDCVGYVVNNSLGYVEDDAPRMVMTPWSSEALPFSKAAEIGTRKVMTDHSAIGVVVTTDGTITDIDREDYLEAEDRIITEMIELNKPFVVLLNSVNPFSERARSVKEAIEEKYGISVLTVNCNEMNISDVTKIMETILLEFPLTEIGINIPSWIENLEDGHWLKSLIREKVVESVADVTKIREAKNIVEKLSDFEYAKNVSKRKINLGDGTLTIDIETHEDLFYKIIEETSGFKIDSSEEIIYLLRDLSKVKKEYEKVAPALEAVSRTGYGIIAPTAEELTFEEPEIVNHGGKYCVHLRASAPSIHMIRADIETEVSPIVGNAKQSKELLDYLLSEFETDPKKIWESNIFGKSIHDLVNEDLHSKLYRMPEDAQFKLQETLQKIINGGAGGLICIIL
jgi:stage IV sporulation protein A